jgi:ubiquinone/menaquinone biosynthesis C-methylase UbiE
MSEPNSRFQGSIPEIYDRNLGPVIFGPYAIDLARRVTAFGPGSVLEVACGTGIVTRHLREALPRTVRLVATDLNVAMVDHARERLQGLEPIEWQQADAAALPFASDSFDAVACQFGLMFVPDKEAAFREARRVLTVGGWLAFNVWDGFEHNSFGRLANDTIRRLFPSDPPTFFTVPFGFRDRDALRRLLDDNRFTDVTMEAVRAEARSESARSFAFGFVKGNPVSIAIEERGGSVDAVVDALAEEYAREGGERPFRSTMQALVVTARAR